MNVIDNFLDKYSYRFPKGYPDLTDPADKKLMQELLSEIGVDEAVKDDSNSIFATKGPKENDPSYKQILRDAGLSEKILNQIEKVFNDLAKGNDEYISNFNKTFRSKSITQIKDIFDAFSQYVNIYDKGLGRGEVATIMGTIDSKSGGQSTKDIIISNDGDNTGEWDVKELDTDGQFRTASGGYITTSTFKHNLDHFISLLTKLVKNKGSKEVTGNADIDGLINKLLVYYNSAYKSGGISSGTFDDITTLCNSLSTYEFGAGKTNIHYVKIAGRRFSVDPETYDKIEKGEKINNINLGNPVSDETSLLTKIKAHPWVKNPEIIEKELKEIWEEFLTTIQGLILIDKKTGIPTLYTSDELKDQFTPIRVVQNQINVKEKARIKKAKIKENDDDYEEDEEYLYND